MIIKKEGKIKELYAWLLVLPDQSEQIMFVREPEEKVFFALVGNETLASNTFKHMAETHAYQVGGEAVLKRFVLI